jgi:hypothetical protein
MRSAIFLIISLLMTGSALAQQQFREEPPDFSRDTLLRLFAENPEREKVEPRFRHELGMIEFRTRNIRWRVGYLPFFLPLHGSQPWDHDQRWPDPFILTGTEIAHTSRTWRDRRAMSSELRRIDRKIRESAVVRVQPD